jgi:anti-sigma regulatory factor (Ser/Thr protein kinase)
MWTRLRNSKQMAFEHSQMQSVILQRTAELQNLSQRLLKVQDEERRKLSRELHDSTGQTLAALKISVSFLEERCKKDPAIALILSDVTHLADQAIEEIRTKSYLLHPPLLDEVGFACAAEWYVEGFAKRSRVSVKLDIATVQQRLPIGAEIALFRVLQESLTNVHRHSGASEVTVCFQQQLEKIILEIHDDGCGIPAERLDRLRETSAATGVGLAGMRERMNELKGKLEIESDGHGTTLRAIVPLSALTTSRQLGDCRQMTVPSIHRGKQQLPACCICNSPVPLETCKTDENGQAVHEECYVLKVCAATWLLAGRAPTSGPANRHPIIPPCEAKMPADWESLRPTPSGPLATMLMQRAKRFPWHKQPWNLRLAAFVTVLVLSGWIAYGHRHSASSAGSFEMRRTTAVEEQVSLPANTMMAEYKPTVQTVPIPAEEARTAKPHRRVGLEEQKVVHIGEDVTVRYFSAKPAPRRGSAGQHQVIHMGEDVTVRYFTPLDHNTRN